MTTASTTQSNSTDNRSTWVGDLADLNATTALAKALAALAKPGLCVLLEGPVGAGKSYFARSTIQTLMAQFGGAEDVPSPTFTLVQTYELGPLEVWHADLYRLTNPNELTELGLEQAFDTSLCLIEWPDRLGHLRPDGALAIALTPDAVHQDRRRVQITGPNDLLTALTAAMENA